MLKRKQIREKGKIKLSSYFQKLKEGDKVSVIKELATQPSFPNFIQGRTGVIERKRGNSYVVKIKIGQDKRFIIHPVHLKILKIKIEKANKLKEELKNLELLKLKEEDIVKIIDLMPEDVLDLNKIFVDVALNEDETNKI